MSIDSDINVGSIEEDIKILERFKNDEMQRDKLERDNRCGGWKIGDIYKLLELNTAIEHILSDYTRQKQINEELIKKVKRLEEQVEYDKTHIYTPLTIQLNFIPTQKIKDDIKILKKMLKATMEGKLQEYTLEEIIIKINTLEELLQEEDK